MKLHQASDLTNRLCRMNFKWKSTFNFVLLSFYLLLLHYEVRYITNDYIYIAIFH